MAIRMVGGWSFLLVPAHPGGPRQRAIKRLLLLLYDYMYKWDEESWYVQLRRWKDCQRHPAGETWGSEQLLPMIDELGSPRTTTHDVTRHSVSPHSVSQHSVSCQCVTAQCDTAQCVTAQCVMAQCVTALCHDMVCRSKLQATVMEIWKKKTKCSHSLEENSVLHKVIRCLPSFVVKAPSLNCFKVRCDKLWSNQDVLYNFKAPFSRTGNRSYTPCNCDVY